MGDTGEADVDLDLLREAARDFLTGRVAHDSVKELAGMDWTGLLVDENLGGSGWRPVEATVIAEELGRAQNLSTWFGCVLSGAALSSAPSEVRDRWLPAMLDGTAMAGCALAGDTVRVVRGDAIDILVTLGRNGIHLFEVSDATPRRPDDELLDVTRAAWRVDISGADSVLIGGPQRADQVLAAARVLLSADSLGAVSMTFERLVAYLKERIAFGAPIASFQAVQHRLVDLVVFEAKARAVIMKAARALASDGDPDDAIVLSDVAHAFVTANATAAVDECMQLSGGIGFTWEYPLHHELRRVFTNSHLLGTARTSRARVAERSGW
ncbi:alkylation response protein AidB-like acyl-CoA dehydrogenase [Mycobacterium sp. OAS707]|uniref:acyl-CoA dehydrogenase family protein n=1 Tax=Mycobacterium sp. OAS707 TaxID=2663822 RepID=UPI0017897485|nr:acyl-CoA dehydrogenase family protein [Mycobacterium sp. OAS707]MBE1549399.1 alkylation response protein AidB-like acyl-CoA dehydrogenase [Mycobacterium sp. OAS707]